MEAACTTAGCQTGGVANVTTLDSGTYTLCMWTVCVCVCVCVWCVFVCVCVCVVCVCVYCVCVVCMCVCVHVCAHRYMYILCANNSVHGICI